jgi:hypothetical protein
MLTSTGLVTKVREAQQHLAVKNTRVVVPVGATLDSMLDEQDAMRKGHAVLGRTLHPAERGHIIWDGLQLLAVCFTL